MTEDAYLNALMADAAYIKFGNNRGEIPESFENNFVMNRGFSKKEWTFFRDRFHIMDHIDDPITGFSATLFRDQEKNDKLTLAIAGTLNVDPGDILQDFLIFSGLSLAAGSIGVGQVSVLDTFLADNGLVVSQDDATFLHDLNVTGHSLGGHLALVTAYKYPLLVDQVYSYNGAGLLSTDVSAVTLYPSFDAMWANTLLPAINGSSLDPSRVHSFFGEAGLEVVASDIIFQRPNEQQGIFIENHGIIDTHYMKHLVDSLGLYQIYTLIDPTLDYAERYSHIAAMIAGISEEDTGFIQKNLDAIAELFQVTSDSPGPADPQSIMAALEEDGTTYSVQPLHGKSAHSINTTALTDGSDAGTGYRYALANLLPFAITSNTASTAAASPQYDLDAMSKEYISDRALMLYSLLYKNENNLPHAQLWTPTRFSDAEQQIRFNGDGFAHPPIASVNDPIDEFENKRSEIAFGSAGADVWTTAGLYTSDNDDRLYGMGGNDVIHALDGADHVEGGDGDDTLHGGAGSDTLFGGSGADQIEGGAGTDYLLGGEGSDRFYWNDSDGRDFIGGADTGGDTIWVNGIDLATLHFEQISQSSTWYTDSAHPDVSVHHSGNELTILVGDGPQAGEIHVLEYHASTGSDFGIQLNAFAATPAPDADIFVDTLGTALDDGEVDWDPWFRLSHEQNGIDWETATITFIADEVPNYTGGTLHGTQGGAFFGGPQEDFLAGDADQNALHGLAGDDHIDGAAGDDFLEGFAGSDHILGGAGDDLIFGSANLGWGARRNPVYANEVYVFDQLSDTDEHSNTLDGGAGNDIISGGAYLDNATGGTGNDGLFGGSGNDILSGGAGHDILYGDSTFSYREEYVLEDEPNQYGTYTIHEIAFADGSGGMQQFDDRLSGGAGNDILWGELGNDTLLGGAGDDVLTGDRDYTPYFETELPAFEGTSPALNQALHGDDELYGGDGSDTLYGLGGDDLLAGGADSDVLIGGAGNDTYVMQTGDNQDFIFDAQGHHTLVFQGVQAESLFVVFQGETVYVGIGDITSTDRFILSREQWNNTSIAINSPENTIDRARVYAAYASADREVLLEIPGLRGISEAERNAIYTIDDSDPEQPRIVLETDTRSAHITPHFYDIDEHRVHLEAVPFSGGVASTQFTLDIKLLFGSEGWADFDWSGFGDKDRTIQGIPIDNLQGGSGHDHIIGTSGADQISGNGGNDILEGRGGNDELFGGFGNNVLVGGPGSDHLAGGLDASYEFSSGDGHDFLNAATGAKLNFYGVDADSVALVYTGTENSTFEVRTSGNTVAAAGITTIDALGALTVNGTGITLRQQSDLENGTFYGSRLDDVFDSGSGNDIIHADARGNDRYLFTSGGGSDTIVESPATTRERLGTLHFSSNVDMHELFFEFEAPTADARIFHGSDAIHLDGALYTDWHNPLALFTLAFDAAPGTAPIIRARDGYSGAWLYGSFGTDNIISDDRAHVIRPGYGDDLIQAGGGEDYILLSDHYLHEARHQGIGNKVILGGTGDDRIVAPLHQGLTFVYNLGDGIDTIEYDWSYAKPEDAYAYDIVVDPQSASLEYTPRGEDTLSFGAGITLEDLDFTRLDADLEIAITGSHGGILVENFFLAYDVPAPSGLTPAQLEPLSQEGFVADLLTHTYLLGSMPDTPIHWLDFIEDGPLLMSDALADNLSELAVLPGITQLGSIGDDTIVGEPGGINVIQSRQGNDDILVNGGNNTIDAGAGDDTITASGDNTVFAGAGNDSIQLTGGDNYIDAGRGDDAVFLEGGVNYIDLGEGEDYASLAGGHNTLRFGADEGYKFVDVFIESNSSIVIEMADGLTPDDVTYTLLDFGGGPFIDIYVAQTNATLSLGLGEFSVPQAGLLRTADAIHFSNGITLNEADILDLANPSNGSTLIGTMGTDTLIGSAHADTLNGLLGDDDLRGGEGDDTLIGGGGNDLLHGGAGNDVFTVQGLSDGYDRVIGAAGFDTLRGSDGNDLFGLTALKPEDSLERIDGREGVFDVIIGDNNANHLDFSATELVNILAITGAGGEDAITGTSDADVILGGAGNDVIEGGTGNDDLRGDAGDDLFIVEGVEQGFDKINGGAGFDTLRGGIANNVFGFSSIDSADSLERIDGGGGVFNVIAGDASANHLDFSATELINILAIVGAAGNDTIVGSQAADIINGDGGDDVLMGAAGNDFMNGGAGDDQFLYSGTGNGYDFVNGGEGFDTLLGTENNDVFGLSHFAQENSIERIDGAGAVFNVITGDASDNQFDFSATQLINILAIVGGQGADTIIGSSGSDIINGDAGNDIISGSAGDDILNGGQGNDTYQFFSGSGVDTVWNSDSNLSSIDTIEVADVAHDELWFSRHVDDLIVDFVGTDDRIDIKDWYARDDAQIDSFHVDERILQRNQVDALVNAMAGYAPPDGAGSVIPEETRLALEPTLSAVWQAA